MKPAYQHLRNLAKRTAELAASEANIRTRGLWEAHNQLQGGRPLVYVRLDSCWDELLPSCKETYPDPILGQIERNLQARFYNAALGFDFVIDPFVTVPAVYAGPADDALWGVPVVRHQPEMRGSAWVEEPPLKSYRDLDKLRKPPFIFNETATKARVDRVREAIGDLLEVQVSYDGPIGISAQIGHVAASLRGMSQLMVDVMDEPEGVHGLMRFLMEAHLEYLDAMEQQQRVSLNRTRWPFYHPPLVPGEGSRPTQLKDCWGYAESQEFDLFSPAMFDEFLLAYQVPILARTTLNDYGCCENLSLKYPLLMAKVPGLRLVSVSPWSSMRAAVAATQGRVVLEWRYSPTEVIFNFAEEQVRKVIRSNLEMADGAPVVIILQDVETVNGRPEHIRDWTRIAMELAKTAPNI